MKQLLLLLSILISSTIFSQSPSMQWKRINKGAFSGDETVLCSARDNAGNNYLCGYNASSTWIAKFDNTGANTYSFTFVDSSNAYITPVKLFVDAAFNIYMVGTKYDGGNVNPIVVKFDQTGNVLWINYYSNNSYNIVDDALIDNLSSPNYIYYTGRINDSLGVVKISTATGITSWKTQLNPFGNIYSRGLELAYLNGNIYATGVTYNPTTYLDAYTVKLTSNGAIFYENESNLAGVDNSEHLIVNSSGDAFVFGVSYNTGPQRFYLKRISTGGNVTWTTNLSPAISGGGLPNSLDAIGMAANISNTTFYLLGNGTNPNVNLRSEYNFVVNSSGTVLNSGEYTNGADLDQYAVKSDNAGNFFVLGKQNGTLPQLYVAKFGSNGGSAVYRSSYVINTTNAPVDLFLDNNSNVYASSNVFRNNVNMGDGLLVKFGQTGNLIWDGIYDGQANGYDYGHKVFVAPGTPDLYTIGTIQNNGTGRDVVIKKYDTEGNEQWATTIDNDAMDDNFLDARQDQYNVTYMFYSNNFQGYITKIDNIGSQLYNKPVGFNYGIIRENRNTYGTYIGNDGNYNSLDFQVEAYDYSGQYLYTGTTSYFSGGYTQVRAIEYDNAGNIYVFGNVYNPSTGITDLYVQQFDNAGNQGWRNFIPGLDNGYYKNGVDMKFNASGDLVLLAQAVKPGESKASIVLSKITTAGVVSAPVFYNNFVNTNDQAPVGFVFDANNNIVVYGKVNTGPTSAQAILARFDNSFAFQWVSLFATGGSGNQDVINSVSVAGTNVYATGLQTIANNESSIIIAKIGNNGSTAWLKNYEGPFAGYNEGKSIATDNNRVYVVGAANESPGAQYDMIVIKYCDNPRPLVTVSGSTQICSNQSATLSSFGSSVNYQWSPGNVNGSTIQVNQSGFYYVTATESDGCTRASDSVHITIKAAPVTPNICAVTVDSLSTHNILQWDKSAYTDIDHFNIYREDATNIYTPIGSVPFDSLSEYHDYGANPNITTKRYKLSAVDTCGVESALSPYHNTIYVTYSGNGQYNWNLYTIEGGANPVNNYLLMRDDLGNGNWAQIGSTAGSQGNLNDPNYASYPAGRWRVETAWGITCTPTRGAINTSRSNIKSPSSVGLDAYATSTSVSIYPNPANEQVTVGFDQPAANTKILIYDALGKLVYDGSVKAGQQQLQINTSAFESGIYMLEVNSNNGRSVRKLFIE